MSFWKKKNSQNPFMEIVNKGMQDFVDVSNHSMNLMKNKGESNRMSSKTEKQLEKSLAKLEATHAEIGLHLEWAKSEKEMNAKRINNAKSIYEGIIRNKKNAAKFEHSHVGAPMIAQHDLAEHTFDMLHSNHEQMGRAIKQGKEVLEMHRSMKKKMI